MSNQDTIYWHPYPATDPSGSPSDRYLFSIKWQHFDYPISVIAKRETWLKTPIKELVYAWALPPSPALMGGTE